MTSKHLILSVLIIMFFSCGDDESLPPIEYGTGPVDLMDIKVGQKSTYLSFFGVCGDTAGVFDQQLPDTLLLEVIDGRDGVLTFSERLTEGSNLYKNGRTQIIEYEVVQKDGYILIPERDSSALFYFYANDTLHIVPTAITPLKQTSCYLMDADSTFEGNYIGLVKDYQILSKALDEIWQFPVCHHLYWMSSTVIFYTIRMGCRSPIPSNPVTPTARPWLN